MLKSAFSYLSNAAATVGATASAGLAEVADSESRADPIVGSTVDVGGMSVRVRKRIGEGGFAFVYAVEQIPSPSSPGGGRALALKRLLAMDSEKRFQIVNEMSVLKALQASDHVLKWVGAANLASGSGLSSSRCEEFLLLTELCNGSLYDYPSERSMSYPPETVARIFHQTLQAVSFMHSMSPPLAHRDLKIENLLIDGQGSIKLCDFGSTSSQTFVPDETWNMSRRNDMETELARFTTPMYRAPEMVDVWSNYPVNCAVDVWALGCLLYQFCFHHHPFEDGAKLRIINAKYVIPETDTNYVMFHDLIRQMLAVDPTCRPTCQQLLQHLASIAVVSSWDLNAKIDLEAERHVQQQPLDDSLSTTAMEARLASRGQQMPSFGSEAAASSAAGLISSFKGGAGSVIRTIQKSSKAALSSLMTSKGLDLDCLTTRVAAMSFPADGIDLGYRNQAEDVRQILESRHAEHYAVVNVCERKYASTRFTPSGRLIEGDWSSAVTPSLEQILDVTMQTLEFLGLSRQNIVALHCLDGKSNTAVLFAALMLVSRSMSRAEDALHLFELRRCEPLLSCGQRAVLKHLQHLLTTGPSLQIAHQSVVITSIVMEPIPLFTKANDGCRPFVEIYSGNNLVASTMKDYSAMTLFTPYDGEIVLKMSVVVAGDITILAYHARQSIGTFFAGKIEKVPICRVYFNPAYLSATSKSHIRFRTHELDFLGEAEKVPQGFALSVNFGLKDKRTTEYPYKMPEKKRMELLFSSKSEFEEATESVGSTRPSPTSEAHPEMPPERPPREKRPDGIAKEMPKPASMADMATLRDAHPVSGLLKEQHKPSSLVDLNEHSADSVIVGDLLGGSHPKEPVRSDVGVAASGAAVFDQDPSPLLDFAAPSSFPAPKSLESSAFGSRDSAFPPADFGAPAQVDDAFLIDIGGSSQQQTPKAQSNLFDFSAGAADLLEPTSSAQQKRSDDLFGNVLPPAGGFGKRSESEKMIDEMLSRLGTGETKPASSASSASQQRPPPQAQAHASKPNYNSSFFQAPGVAGVGGRPKTTKDSFGDLLGGFAPLSSTETKTIGEMKKAEEKRNMTPEEARVFEWTHGKSRNLRALLCSLDTVIWEGSRWEKCGMHNLVTFNDVKKMYRKACLAVHPDKQTGTANENLSKIIFTELNDGWSKFQEDEQAS